MNDQTRKITDTWKDFGSLINTGLLVVVALTYFVTFGRTQEGMVRDIAGNKQAITTNHALVETWKTEHLAFHRERSNEATAERARMDERLKQVERLVGVMENLTFRISATEIGLKEIVSGRAANDEKLNKLVTDVAIIKDQLLGRPGSQTR